MPWVWGGSDINGNGSILVLDEGSGAGGDGSGVGGVGVGGVGVANQTMGELPCDGARYAFLSCVVGMLTLALFLRVSWVPKVALTLLLAVLYVAALELSGYRKIVGYVRPRACVCVCVWVCV